MVLTYRNNWFWGRSTDPLDQQEYPILCADSVARSFNLETLPKRIKINVYDTPTADAKLMTWRSLKPHIVTLDGQMYDLNRHAFAWLRRLARPGRTYVAVTPQE